MQSGVGIWVKLYHRVLSFHFLVSSTFTAYTGFPLNAPKTCFGGGNVPLGSVCPGVKSSFLPQKNSMGRQTWRSKFGNKSRPVIDGCCEEKSIADQFASVF